MGWLVAGWLAAVVVRLRLRLELVARAEHELRGPLTAFGLALDAARGTAAGRRLPLVPDAALPPRRGSLWCPTRSSRAPEWVLRTSRLRGRAGGPRRWRRPWRSTACCAPRRRRG